MMENQTEKKHGKPSGKDDSSILGCVGFRV